MKTKLGLLLLCLVLPLAGFAEVDKSLFQTKGMAAAIGKLTKNAKITDTDKVVIRAPKIAEDGRFVGVRVSSSLKNVEQIALFAESNQFPMVANYSILKGAEPAIRSRIKVGKPSNIVAIVKADGKYYRAKQFVKVTIGGCGGGSSIPEDQPGDKSAKK